MSHTPPSRAVKCQICSWKGIRKYGPDGILCDPCPECGRLVTYAAPWAGDPPVTQDVGQPVRPRKRKRVLSPEPGQLFWPDWQMLAHYGLPNDT
jgi:hypothetical protein